jgi:hypothetical protein
MLRDDVSERLIHLTRGESDQAAADAFLSIWKEETLRGASRCIKGAYQCICFSEAPITKLAHILADESHGMRYSSFGVMVGKKWLFEQGGRPVIYQPACEFELLHESQRFRHVTYEPPDVDFTWEREWRIKTDELQLDPAAMTLVVPTRDWETWVLDQHLAALQRRALISHGFGPRVPFKWHFIVLSDLGIDVEGVQPPTKAK